MVKLADTLDLGSSAIACRFKSCHPYQRNAMLCIAFFLSFGAPPEIRRRVQRTCRNSKVGKFICKTKRQSVKRSSPCIARKQYWLFNLRWERKSTLIECAFLVTHRRFELRTIALKVRCSTGWASESLAGVAGFEPTNARIKIWCLTAWRYPYPAQSIISLHKTFCNKINRFFANNLFALQIPIKSSFFGLYQTPKRRLTTLWGE